MTISVTFFPDSDYEYAVKINTEKRQICIDVDGVESPFHPTSNTYQYCHYYIEDEFVIPDGMSENEAIIARLKELMEEVKDLPAICR